MSVGILLVTHNTLGETLVKSALEIFKDAEFPLPLRTLAFGPEMKAECLCEAMYAICDELNQGDGVLILTDLYGATPCNVARRLKAGYRVRTVAGLNLPMLLKVMNYAKLDLDHLTRKAEAGAHEGIREAEPDEKAAVP
jgi:PTS system ascorbate-specific IIA component